MVRCQNYVRCSMYQYATPKHRENACGTGERIDSDYVPDCMYFNFVGQVKSRRAVSGQLDLLDRVES